MEDNLLGKLYHNLTTDYVHLWAHIQDESVGIRVYYNYKPEDSGFEFYVLNRISYYEKDLWQLNDGIEILLRGFALFDGIRHLYAGDGGYFNYPNFTTLKSAFNMLELLEKKYCPQK
jgi:hypothetical protein